MVYADLVLTDAGRVFLKRAEHMLAEAKATREEMLEFAQLDRTNDQMIGKCRLTQTPERPKVSTGGN